MAKRALEAAFLAVVRAPVDVLLHAVGERNTLANSLRIDETSEIDPLSAII